ncbi:MAG: hypothetical protein U9N50_06010 [Pseudomonadota bacterium]|nr:hypothetical protein [Pseudomonadota bacterium]
MRAFRNIFLVSVIVPGTSSCTIQHVIEKDYPEYPVNSTGTASLPNTDKASEYILTPNMQQHCYEFWAVSTGYANLWIVEFGKMLDDTLWHVYNGRLPTFRASSGLSLPGRY